MHIKNTSNIAPMKDTDLLGLQCGGFNSTVIRGVMRSAFLQDKLLSCFLG